MGETVKRCAHEFPLLEMDAVLQPITRTIVRIRLKIIANFRYVSTILNSSKLYTEAVAPMWTFGFRVAIILLMLCTNLQSKPCMRFHL